MSEPVRSPYGYSHKRPPVDQDRIFELISQGRDMKATARECECSESYVWYLVNGRGHNRLSILYRSYTIDQLIVVSDYHREHERQHRERYEAAERELKRRALKGRKAEQR